MANLDFFLFQDQGVCYRKEIDVRDLPYVEPVKKNHANPFHFSFSALFKRLTSQVLQKGLPDCLQIGLKRSFNIPEGLMLTREP